MKELYILMLLLNALTKSFYHLCSLPLSFPVLPLHPPTFQKCLQNCLSTAKDFGVKWRTGSGVAGCYFTLVIAVCLKTKETDL